MATPRAGPPPPAPSTGAGVDPTSALRASNRLLRMVTAVTKALLHAEDEHELLERVCRIIVDLGGYRLAWIGFASDAEGKPIVPVAYAGVEAGYIESLRLTWADVERGRGPSGVAVREGRSQVAQNILTDPAFAPWRDAALERGFQSSAALPLRLREGPAGTLSVYAGRPDAFAPEELSFLEELARDISYGVDNLRMRAQRDEAQASLRRSERGKAALLEALPDIVVRLDADGRLLDYYAGKEAEPPAPPETFLGRRLVDVLPEPWGARALEVVRRALSTPGVHTLDADVHARGAARAYEARFVASGRDEVTAIVREVTARKRQERELRLWAEVFARAGWGIAVGDPSTDRLLAVNEAFAQMHGYAPEEMRGFPVAHLFTVEAQVDLPAHQRRSSDEGTHTWESTHVRRDGSTFPVLVNVTLVRDDQGRPLFRVANVQDLTERKRAEQLDRLAFEQGREIERLKDLDRFRADLMRATAHELNNPITPIRLAIFLLKEESAGELTPRGKRDLEVLERNVERMVRLVQDLLEASRIEQGRLHIERARTDLSRVAREAVDTYETVARDAGVTLRARIEDGVVLEAADRRRIESVALNLVSNAVKYTPTGGRVDVLVERTRDGGARLRVVDTGLGMTREQLARLFRPFGRMHEPPRKADRATGLGLYLTKGIVELHGGTIEAESEGPGRGSAFTVWLPQGV